MSLQINDLFWTLQGEGFWTGRRALFVRLPYCNYDCPWCDTSFNSCNLMTTADFEKFTLQEPAKFAVITGGEPLAHKDLPQVLEILKRNGFYIACETNGSFSAPPEIDFITASPKPYAKNKSQEPYYIHPTLQGRVSEYKYVVDDVFQFDILARHSEEPVNTLLSLSPEFSQMQKNVEKIMAYIQKNPRWKLSLQTHKWINIP